MLNSCPRGLASIVVGLMAATLRATFAAKGLLTPEETRQLEAEATQLLPVSFEEVNKITKSVSMPSPSVVRAVGVVTLQRVF